MRTNAKRIVALFICLLIVFQIFAQQPLSKKESDQLLLERQKYNKLEIREIKGYQCNYTNNKKDEGEGVIVEHKKINSKGFVEYEFTSIDPELSYIKAKGCLASKESSELILTDGGVYESKVGIGDFVDLYLIPSVTRYFNYEDDKLVKTIESYIIDRDTTYTLSDFYYISNSPLSVTEQVISKSKSWVVCSSRDFYLNDQMDISKVGPYTYGYFANYHYNNNNNIQQIDGMHSFNNFKKLVYFDQQGNIERIVLNYGKIKKPVSEYSFQYDINGNEVFADIKDVPGHVQVSKRYDENNNLIEYSRIQLDDDKKLNYLIDYRYMNSLYTYDDKNLLKERIDIGKTK